MYKISVKCDSENNPPEIIEGNELWARISIIPVHSVEFHLVEGEFNELIGKTKRYRSIDDESIYGE